MPVPRRIAVLTGVVTARSFDTVASANAGISDASTLVYSSS
jgi:hypothetical protein